MPAKPRLPPGTPGPRPKPSAGFLATFEAQAAADAREAELVEAQRKLIRSLGEAGYVSGWQTALEPEGPAGFGDWRRARNDYAATGDKSDLQRMLWYVTHQNPPLAKDAAPEKPPAGPRFILLGWVPPAWFWWVLVVALGIASSLLAAWIP